MKYRRASKLLMIGNDGLRVLMEVQPRLFLAFALLSGSAATAVAQTVALACYDVTPPPVLPSPLETTSSVRMMASARSRIGRRKRRLSFRRRR